MTTQQPPKDEPSTQFSESSGNHALSSMLSGTIVGGLLGWGLTKLTGQEWTFVIGLLAGIGLSWYSIWLRFVRPNKDADVTDEE